MARKLTPNQKAYRQQEQRIQRYINRYEKQGFIFEYKLPSTPKRITKQSIQRLKAVTAKELQKTATAPDVETGELIKGTEAIKQRRSIRRLENELKKRSLIAPETEERKTAPAALVAPAIIENFRDAISALPPKVVEWLNGMLDDAIRLYGVGSTAAAVLNTSPKFNDMLSELQAVSYNAVTGFMSFFLDMASNLSATQREELEASFESESYEQ